MCITAEQVGVRCVILRGGTSKGIFIRDTDLPPDPAAREKVILRLFGSPDVRQIDGLGGSDPLTSKLAVVGKSKRADADVAYTFGQVSTVDPFIDWAGNCGNISSAVGPYAIDEKLVPVRAGAEACEVRIHQTNTDAILIARVPLAPDGRARVGGTCSISGVPGTAAPIELDFRDTAGAVTGKLLPTSNARDTLDLVGGGSIEVSIVDAGTPTVFLRASDVGLSGRETPSELEAKPGLLEQIERIRGAACVRLGLVERAEDAQKTSPYLPFIACVAPPQPYTDFTTGERVDGVDFLSRLFFMQRLHKAYPVTGTVATGAAAKLPGTIVHEVQGASASDAAAATAVRIGHPSGEITIDVGLGLEGPEAVLQRAVLVRTARRLMDGTAYV